MKKCPQCGRDFPDGNKFCSVCGSKLPDIQGMNRQSKGNPGKTGQSGEGQQKNYGNSGYGQPENYGSHNCGQPGAYGNRNDSRPENYRNPIYGPQGEMNQGYQQPAQANFNYENQLQHGSPVKPPKKKFSLIGKIGIAVMAVAVVVLVGSVALGLIGSGSAEDIAYLSGGRYYSLKDAKKNETTIIPSSYMEDDAFSTMLQFSPDGKYVYYLGSYDSYDGTGELWKCEYKKLGNNSSKNEKYCEKIDSNVKGGFFVAGDDSVVYITGSDELKYFNGKNTYYFADVSYFYSIKGDNRIAYEIENPDSGYSLYGIDLKNPDEKILLADGYSTCYNILDFENFYYGVSMDDVNGDYDDDEMAIYATGFGKEPEKVGQGSYDTCYCNGESAYQLEETGIEVKASDLFQISGLSADEFSILESDLVGDMTYKTLYAYKDGKRSVISDRVMEGVKTGNSIFYIEGNQMVMPRNGMNTDDLLYALENNIEEMLFDSCVFVYSPVTGKSVQFTYATYQSVNEIMDNIYDASFYITETDAAIYYDGKVYIAKIEDDKIQSFSLLADNSWISESDSSTIYYVNNSRTEGENSCYDVYTYENGESRYLVMNALDGNYNRYKDNSELAYTDYEEDQGYTATFCDKEGNSYEVGKGYNFVRVGESRFLYQNNGDLWLSEKGESNLVARDVDVFWNKDSMELNYNGLYY